MKKDYFLYENTEVTLFEKNITNIYDRIDDEISKQIFINRVNYSITLNPEYIRNVVLLTDIGKELDSFLSKIGNRPILIYGAGKRGIQLLEVFPNKNWAGFIDRKKTGMVNDKYQVKPLEEYINLENYFIIVSNQIGYKEIEKELINRKVKANNIALLEEWNIKLQKKQYIEKRCINLQNVEGYIDGGAFDGEDCLKIISQTNKNNLKIWAYEPDIVQYDKCKERFEKYDYISLINSGLSDIQEKGALEVQQNGGTHFASGNLNGIECHMNALDEMIPNQKIDFIKLDIEGYEEKALWGAKNIIIGNHPKLAVSVYHKRYDIWRLPSVLLKLDSNYRFKFGHYSVGHVDTVLYAYIEEKKCLKY